MAAEVPTLSFYIHHLFLLREPGAENYVRGMPCPAEIKTNRIQFKCILLFLMSLLALNVYSQEGNKGQYSLKTNLLADLTATINIGAEMKIAPKWSVDLSANFNAWSFSGGRKWKQFVVQPEVRYWLCDGMAGHFFAAHALGGRYNFGHLGFAHNFLGVDYGELRNNRYEGWAGGAGIGYGYCWVLKRHWNIEAEIGLGFVYAKYDKYECEGCGRRTDSGHKVFFTPTKAAVNIIYVF